MRRFSLPHYFFTATICVTCLCQAVSVQAQDEKVREEIEAESDSGNAAINVGADLMSRFIWRGIDLGNSPAIQPNLSFSYKGLEIGVWGSYAISGYKIQLNDSTVEDAGMYAETDLYISYTYKWFTLMVFDYFTVNGLNPNAGNRFFDYNQSTTGHAIEGCLSFDGPENFPVQIMASVFLYGDDKNRDLEGVYGQGTKNNYSTYGELAYKIKLKRLGVDLMPFIGGIPFGSSVYGPSAGITNLGLKATKEIPVTAEYAFPVEVSLITNPQAQSVFLIFGISF